MNEPPGLSRSISDGLGAGPTLPVPDRIGRYHVIDRLASGGMAEVFICAERQSYGERSAALERLVVVKRILPHLAIHQAFVDMFLAEARYVARINHQNVVQIYELGEDNGLPFLSMEYVAGCSLRDLLVAAIQAGSPLPPGVAAALAAQSCAGAHAAHELKDGHGKLLGLVHRDISPHNLMVTADGHVKLLDFGIAKATEASGLQDNTRTGALKGKVHYMAPEQCKQEPLDRRADVFALGIVAWELFAKERLFKRDSELDAMQAIVTGDLKDLRLIRKDVPTILVAAIEKALQAKKETRFQTAEAFRLALLDAARGLDTSSDAVAAFVRPLLGKELNDRRESFVRAAAERTTVTGTGSESGLGENDSTVVDKPPSLTAARHPQVTADASALEKMGTEGPANVDTSTVKGGKKAGPQPFASLLAAPGTSPSTVVSLSGHSIAEAPPPSSSKQALTAVLIAAGSCAVVVVALLLLLPWLRAPSVSGTPLVIAWPPTVDPELLVAELPVLDEVLERLTHRPVELRVESSYDATANALKTGTAAFAVLPPYLFVTTRREIPGIVPLATKIVDGSTGSDGVLLVREDGDINTVADLKGKTFCFPGKKSATGYILPRAKFKEAGLDPDVDIIEHMSGNHTQVLKDLTSGVCAAGATYSGGYLAADRAGVSVGRARVLLLTGRSPQDMVVAAPTTSADDRAILQKALLALDPQKELGSDAIGKLERISGFAPPRLADFEALEKAIP
ncbi:MAG: serine/threonine-protein kinase [Deltaproteobacteria bacterium]|nr:serine/threonine-protein kinase [Deltaproteobacteria bacterium]